MMDEFTQFKINDQTEDNFPNPPPPKFNGKRLLKFSLIFFTVLIIIGGGYLAWNNYLSPSAQYSRQAQTNYQKYLDQQKHYEEAMTADTYGGKTPEETLGMFKDALIKGDVDLASNYFLLDDDGEKNPVIKQNIEKIIANGRYQSLLDSISRLVPSTHDTGAADVKDFVTLTPQGIVDYSITLKLNKYSGIWKIENM